MRYLFAAAVACLLLAGPVAADTYYILPDKGSDNGDGSEANPWKTLEAVASSGKLGRLNGGDVVLLGTGHHGSVKFSGNNRSMITIAAGKGQKPTLSRLEIASGKNWHVKGLLVSPSYGESYGGSIVSFGESGQSTDIIVEGCYIFTEEDSTDWSAKQWISANSGVNVGRHGKGLVLRNNYILNTRFGINLASFDAVCEGNVVDAFSADAIRAMRDGQVIRHNVIKNIFVSSADGDKNHDDGIQAFLFNKGTGTVRDITIEGNIIISQEKPGRKFATNMQGIGLFDGPLVDFVVTDNVVNTSHWHGVSLFDAQNAVVERNVVYTDSGGRMKPWIMFGTKNKQAKDNVARNNYAHDFRLDQPGTKEENNQPVNAGVYRQALSRALATIVKKYGREIEAADKPRLGD